MSEEKKVPKRILMTLLSSLSAGVVPRIGAPYIAIGRTKEVSSLCTNLETVKDGGSFTKFIIGKYGSGKSFLISLIRGYAQERNFVCMDCDLSPERRLTSKNGYGLNTYNELVKNLSTKTQDSGALSQILSKWVSDLTIKAQNNGIERDTDDFYDFVIKETNKIVKKIEGSIGVFDFSYVLSKYVKAYYNDDEETLSACLKWLRGEYSTKTEAKSELGVHSIINDESWYDFLKLFALFVKEIGYSGLIIFIDECVNLYKIPNRISRENNYEKILSIYNDTMQGKAGYMGIIFAGTPQFLEDPRRGLFSYEALKSRLIDNNLPFGRDSISPLSPLIRLVRLSDNELLALIIRTTNLYIQAYGDVNISDEEMKDFLYIMLSKAGSDLITPREIIRAYLTLLNEMQTGKSCEELLKMIRPNTVKKDPDELELTDIEI